MSRPSALRCAACGQSLTEFEKGEMDGGAIVSSVAGAIDLYAPQFIRIEPGRFMMGSPEDEPERYDDEILHEVVLTRAFEIAETPVTQGQYAALMGYNPSDYQDRGTDCPVENVSWDEAIAYCNRLSERAGLQPSYRQVGGYWEVVGSSIYDSQGYRLPTEAEWEYAARAGMSTAYYSGEMEVGIWGVKRTQPSLDRIGWYVKNSKGGTRPVKGKAPNGWGLYDMSGNVWEWCHDWLTYELGGNAVTDPCGATTDSLRSCRGGGWASYARLCRSAARFINPPDCHFNFLGFRPVRSVQGATCGQRLGEQQELCGSCRAKNPPGAVYCNKCGERLLEKQEQQEQAVICGSCQTHNSPDSVYCNKCGERLLEKQEQQEQAVPCGSCQAQNPRASRYCRKCGKSMQQDTTVGGAGGKAAAAMGVGTIVSPVVTVKESFVPRFIRVEPGRFMMGSPEDEPGRFDHETQHEVVLTRAFEIAETPVTQGQYAALMGYNPSNHQNGGTECPVENVSWSDAVVYCNRLSELAGLQPSYKKSYLGKWKVVGGNIYSCEGYRLPTEAEWEYAARAGTRTAYYSGRLRGDGQGEEPALDRIGWYDKNSLEHTHAVKGKAPNRWGLYDMSGNIWEWCHDWWVEELGRNSVTDPCGAPTGMHRVVHGGSTASIARLCRSASRAFNLPDIRFTNHGFRPVRTLRGTSRGQRLLEQQEQALICGRCQTHNPCGALYCYECGKSMQQSRKVGVSGRTAVAGMGGRAIVSPEVAPIKGYGPRFIRIEPGRFMMGSRKEESGRDDDEVLHEVVLTRAFEIAETPVTQGQYAALMGYNPSDFQDGGADCPVERVCWDEAIAYCNRLSELAGLQPSYRQVGGIWEVVGRSIYESKGYRLPTEAEWEYVARAGTSTAYYGGVEEVGFWGFKVAQPALDRIGWYAINSAEKTHVVRSKARNAWGLYDMSGNVWEWCHDWWVAELRENLVKDPFGPPTGVHRVLRGGSWYSEARKCRSAYRGSNLPDARQNNHGFRPVRTLR